MPETNQVYVNYTSIKKVDSLQKTGSLIGHKQT